MCNGIFMMCTIVVCCSTTHVWLVCVWGIMLQKKKRERYSPGSWEEEETESKRKKYGSSIYLSLYISIDWWWLLLDYIYTHKAIHTHTHRIIYVIIIIYDISSDLRHTVSGGFSETRLLFTREREREREIFILSKTLNSFHQSLFWFVVVVHHPTEISRTFSRFERQIVKRKKFQRRDTHSTSE